MNTPASKNSIFKTADGKDYTVLFILVTSLFILWGFCNGMIDVLNKHFQNSLHVSKTQSALVQFANYMGYFVMALPAGMIARRWGYKGGILAGLLLIATGAFWFIPATQIGTYWAFLTGLFILAAGMTCLETIANPYATLLGEPETGAARINLAQTCNGIGWILGPLVGGRFVLSSTGAVNTSNAGLYIPYLGIGVVVTLLMLVFFFANVPDIKASNDYEEEHAAQQPAQSIWTHPHFVLAVAVQFFYVAAQTGVFSFFINFIVSDAPLLSASLAALLPQGWAVPEGSLFKITELGSSRLLGLGGFGLFLTGRFVGSMVLRCFKAQSVLAFFCHGQCGDDGSDRFSPGLAFRVWPFHEFLFHVAHVSHHFCARHSWPGRANEKGGILYCHVHRGRCHHAHAHGVAGGPLWDAARLPGAAWMFCFRRFLWVHLGKIKQAQPDARQGRCCLPLMRLVSTAVRSLPPLIPC